MRRRCAIINKKTKEYIRMKNYDDSYISPWGYVGYGVLWAIPVLGWLIWFFNCFSRKTNKRNYARSLFCTFIFGVIVSVVLSAVIFVLSYLGVAPEFTETLEGLEMLI